MLESQLVNARPHIDMGFHRVFIRVQYNTDQVDVYVEYAEIVTEDANYVLTCIDPSGRKCIQIIVTIHIALGLCI